jgi:hypothetical protein
LKNIKEIIFLLLQTIKEKKYFMNRILLFLLVSFFMSLIVTAQTANQPPNLIVCDSDNDGYAIFDLTQQDFLILGTQNPVNFSLAYYETEFDAVNNVNPIANASAYMNVINPQTIYARLEALDTGNASLTSFDLLVYPIPSPIEPEPLEVCDDDNDGFASFDLELSTTEIINGEADVSVTYHETTADAESDTNALVAPYVNIFPDSQVVYVRAENDITGCFAIVEFQLIVLTNPTPSLYIDDLVMCDETNTGDGQEIFDLTVNEAYIINGEAGVTAVYYETQADAITETNPIEDPTNYLNTNTPEQTIYVRVTNDTTGCYTIVNFDLQVNLVPSFYLSSSDQFCNGATLVLDTTLSADNYSFLWNNGETTSQITVNTADTYSVTVTNLDTGCTVTKSTIVTGVDCEDSDSDGVPDMDEDINNNDDLDDDDTDGDGTPNYLDDDDDGDNVPTDIEINIESGRSNRANQAVIDTDGDLIENYLDDDDDGDNVLTIDEDYNNNGDPTDDDTNGNSVPDYLDYEVALGLNDVTQTLFKMHPNPAKDGVTFIFQNGVNGIVIIRVMDIQGKVVLDATQTIETNGVALKLDSLQSGLYLIEVEWQASKLIKKLIIE